MSAIEYIFTFYALRFLQWFQTPDDIWEFSKDSNIWDAIAVQKFWDKFFRGKNISIGTRVKA
jgi:hypothetical protein